MKHNKPIKYVALILSLFCSCIYAQDLTRSDTKAIAEQCKLDSNADCYSLCWKISYFRGFSNEAAKKCVALSKDKAGIIDNINEYVPMVVATVVSVRGRQQASFTSQHANFNKACGSPLLNRVEGSKENLHLLRRGVKVKLSGLRMSTVFHKGRISYSCTVEKFKVID